MKYRNSRFEALLLGTTHCKRAHRPLHYAFTVLELLIVASTIAMLAGLLLPAIQAAREAARQMHCRSNLHQIGLALQSHHNIFLTLPAGWKRDKWHKTAFGWSAPLLPYFEDTSLFSNIDFDAGLLSPKNDLPRITSPNVFRCPSDFATLTFALYKETHRDDRARSSQSNALVELPSSNYLGVFGTSDPDDVAGHLGEGAFLLDSGVRFAELRRGLSHTFLIGERTARKLPSTWIGIALEGEDATGRVVGNAYAGPNRDDVDECEFDSRHPECANFLWADGHVEHVVNDIDVKAYRIMAIRGE